MRDRSSLENCLLDFSCFAASRTRKTGFYCSAEMDIKKVLVADAVDKACVDLLKENDIEVDCKYKLPKEQLVKEIAVSIF